MQAAPSFVAGGDVDRNRLRCGRRDVVVAADRQGLGGRHQFRRDVRPVRSTDGVAERDGHVHRLDLIVRRRPDWRDRRASPQADATLEGGAQIGVKVEGVPERDFDLPRSARSSAVCRFTSAGSLVLRPISRRAFKGNFGIEATDIDPLIRLVGLGTAGRRRCDRRRRERNDLDARPCRRFRICRRTGLAPVRSRARSGSRRSTGAIALGGSLQVDEVDLGWIAALGLGFAPMPTDDPAAPLVEDALRGACILDDDRQIRCRRRTAPSRRPGEDRQSEAGHPDFSEPRRSRCRRRANSSVAASRAACRSAMSAATPM